MNISCQTFSIQRILKSDSSQNKMSLMSCNTICMEHLSCFCGDECLMMIFPVNNNGNLNYSGKVIRTGMKVNLLLSVSSSRSYFNFRIQILVATRYPGCDNNTKTSLSRPGEIWQFVEFHTRFDAIQFKSSRELSIFSWFSPGNICQLHFFTPPSCFYHDQSVIQ